MSNKEFIKLHIPFSTLKKAGMFRDIKRTDHAAIVERAKALQKEQTPQ
jgi:hypothetical protein